MHSDIKEILLTEKEIQDKVKKLAARISKDYKGKDVIFVGVLKGCFVFLADLLKHVDIECGVDFMCVSSYVGEQSTGVVRTILDLRESIENKDVIIVEDIVDSGLTIDYLVHNFKTRKPKSVKICAMLDKRSAREVNVPVKYIGFNIPEKFVVGYGLDYNEYYRNLPYIGVLKKSAIERNDKCL